MITSWGNFFVAIVSAAATLTGLIFVGVSFSLAKILSLPSLPGRASQSLILLITVLIISSLCLVPDQSARLIGIELLCVGIGVWLVTLKLDLSMFHKTEAPYKKHAWLNILFTQLAILPYIIAGFVMLGHGFTGIYWLLPAIIFSFIKAVTDAWVLLVEIHR